MPVITGTGQADVLNGTENPDLIRGLNGNDRLYGFGGDDELEGNDGDDRLEGGAGNDLLHGGVGNDELNEYQGANDQMFGEDGDDRLIYHSLGLGPFATLLDGGAGNDYLEANSTTNASVTMNGGAGHDRFVQFAGGEVVIDAGADADLVELWVGSGRHRITLGGGADVVLLEGLQFPSNPNFVTITDFEAGDDGDSINFQEYFALYYYVGETNPFTTGRMRLVQSGADAILMFDFDLPSGPGNEDILVVFENVSVGSLTAHNLGGFAPDGSVTPGVSFSGSDGIDYFTGQSGDDVITGAGGSDFLYGAGGNDHLEGGDGDDEIYGQTGNDELHGGAGNDRLFDAIGFDDRLYGEGGDDLIDAFRSNVGLAGSSMILDGGDGRDFVRYNGINGYGDITLLGGDGDDSVVAYGCRAMTIDAGAGADFVQIGLGAESCAITLGAGADTLSIVGSISQLSGTGGAFRVLDFDSGDDGDRLEIQYYLQAVLNGWNPASNPFATNYLRLAQSGTDAVLLIDNSGEGRFFQLLGIFSNVDASQLTAFNLGFAPVSPIAIAGTSDADSLVGTGAADQMFGLAGDDVISGLGGADFMAGGQGNDSYYVDNAGDVVMEGTGEGFDRIYSAVSYTLAAGAQVETLSSDWNVGTNAINLTGNELPNILYGNAGNNILDGKAGADTLMGLGGDDSYYVDNAGDGVFESVGGGTDRIFASADYGLGAGQEVEILSTDFNAGTAAINLAGNELSNILYGNAGNNILDGKAGADTLMGLGGNDNYYVDNAGDGVFESVGGGNDRIFASADYGLGAGQEVEILSTDFNAGTAAINLAGNELANILYGNAGNNILDGKAGADTLMGLGGNDNYYVDNAGDGVFESVGGGNDRIFASADYGLAAGVSVETLSTDFNAGTAAINLAGNELSNILYGNAGNNILDGKAGADTLMGLGGDDSYYVDNAGDGVFESAGGGNDRIFASASYQLAAGVSVETLSTDFNAGTAAINLTGNELSNSIYGNAGANVLDGGSGADTLFGLGGADTFAFTSALGGGNVDAILDFASGTDKIGLDDAVFTTVGTSGALNANAFFAGAAAHDADDRIIYDQASGNLYYDADGNGVGAAVLFATLQNHPTIAASDFLVI